MTDKAHAPYPYFGINGEYLAKEFLDEAWRYLQNQAPIWQTGIASPSPADKLAYMVLKQITVRQPEPRVVLP